MEHVVVIGCGIVGASIAYELSQVPGLSVTVFDRQSPAQASTGAALGVLMGVISHKTKGRAWTLRDRSIRRYETLIPELVALTGQPILFNRDGILALCFEAADLLGWQRLAQVRQSQGWRLEILDIAQVQARYPQLSADRLVAGIYSPDDRQVDPVALTQALVAASQGNGVKFEFGEPIAEFVTAATADARAQVRQIETTNGSLAVDWVVVAAGLGSTQLTANLHQSVTIQPVLGQALHLRLEQPLGSPQHQPVMTGEDVHIVPLGNADYWVGATVEFPESGDPSPDPQRLEGVMQHAIAFCPTLEKADVIRTWSGLRPRPEGRSAPVIDWLSGYSNVLLATGHYRNGVLLAPATAQLVREAIVPLI